MENQSSRSIVKCCPAMSSIQGGEKNSDFEIWSGFFRKTLRERQDQIGLVFSDLLKAIPSLNDGGLPLNAADIMVENCIGVCSIPLGVAPLLVLDGVHYVVPMCTEEPSVIAAASSSAKLIAQNGGFRSTSSRNVMTGQVQILDISSDKVAETIERILAHKQQLVEEANTFCESMVRRGGGVLDVSCKILEPYGVNDSRRWIVVHIDIDVCEAMGANIVNSVAEGISPTLAEISGGRIGLRILTNLCLERRTLVSFSLPLSEMAWKGISGREVAERMVEAFLFADLDPFRATTHNKGIMNGIDSVALATGQDWRAIESAAHAFASVSGRYRSLSKYRIDGDFFVGELEIPIAVGTKGGALHSHPIYRFTHGMLGNPSAQKLSQIIVSIGLAQNFAALRALAVEGIQKGHMKLHARNIAVAAGAPKALVAEVVKFMESRSKIDQDTAKQYLEAHSLFKEIHEESETSVKDPSTFHIVFTPPHQEMLSLNVALPCLKGKPQHIYISEKSVPHVLQEQLLGSNKGLNWLRTAFGMLEQIQIKVHTPRHNTALINTIKLYSILLNLVCHNLMATHPKETNKWLKLLLSSHEDSEKVLQGVPLEGTVLFVGFPLILALFKGFRYHVEQFVSEINSNLSDRLLKEQKLIIECISRESVVSDAFATVGVGKIKEIVKAGGSDKKIKIDDDSHELFLMLRIHAKRIQVSMDLFCDAISLPPKLVSTDFLEFLGTWGLFLELEASAAHDVSRWERDLQDGALNLYCFWMNVNGYTESNKDAEKSFFQFIDVIGRYRLLDIRRIRENLSWSMGFDKLDGSGNHTVYRSLLDDTAFEHAVNLIRSHYLNNTSQPSSPSKL